MNTLDLDPKGYLPLLRLLAARLSRRPTRRPADTACCAS